MKQSTETRDSQARVPWGLINVNRDLFLSGAINGEQVIASLDPYGIGGNALRDLIRIWDRRRSADDYR